MRDKRNRTNPFVAPVPVQTRAKPLPHDEVLGEGLSVPGAPIPLGLTTNDLPAPRTGGTAVPGGIHVVGLHGGAGATTVTTLLGDTAHDTHGLVPTPPDGETPKVLLVARGNGAGIAAARTAGRQFAAGLFTGVDVVGLVLVADSPQPPKSLVAACRSVTTLTPRCWRIPWNQDWYEHPGPVSNGTYRTRRVLQDMTKHLTPTLIAH